MSSINLPPNEYSKVIMESARYVDKSLIRRCRNQRLVIYLLLGVIFCLSVANTFLSLKLYLGETFKTEGEANNTVNDLGSRTRNFPSRDDLGRDSLDEINGGRSDRTDKRGKKTPKKLNDRLRPATHQRLNFSGTEHKNNGTLVWQNDNFDGVTFIQGRIKVTGNGNVYALIDGVYDVSVQVKLDSINNKMEEEKYNVRLSIIKISSKGYVEALGSEVTLYKGEYKNQELRMNLRLRKNEGFYVVASWKYLYKSSQGHSLDISLID